MVFSVDPTKKSEIKNNKVLLKEYLSYIKINTAKKRARTIMGT